MREILFRGFCKEERGDDKIIVNGEVIEGAWIRGGVVHQTDYYGDLCDKYFIIDGTDTRDYDIGEAYNVIPETIGQFAGLLDKNGKKIFEGDVVTFFRGRDYFTGSVYYDERSGCFGARDGDDCCLFLDYFLGKNKDDTVWVEVTGTMFDVKESE